ncbi:MAG TPA: cytochrome c-type biogenesis protein CcmH [Candidatus Saccharimonadales bacterium]|nr:cytochrome c-type biogenesis protein CcmH [Candidatus Saccharimonadales bacterium]
MKRLLLTLTIYASLAFLLGAASDDRYTDLGNKIMCSCGCNQILIQCNHVGCTASEGMIRDLRAQVRQSSNDEGILDWFRANYGIAVVVAPQTHGFDLTIWIVPPIVAILAIGLVVWLIYVWSRRPAAMVAAGSAAVLDSQLTTFQDRARKETEL